MASSTVLDVADELRPLLEQIGERLAEFARGQRLQLSALAHACK